MHGIETIRKLNEQASTTATTAALVAATAQKSKATIQTLPPDGRQAGLSEQQNAESGHTDNKATANWENQDDIGGGERQN